MDNFHSAGNNDRCFILDVNATHLLFLIFSTSVLLYVELHNCVVPTQTHHQQSHLHNACPLLIYNLLAELHICKIYLFTKIRSPPVRFRQFAMRNQNYGGSLGGLGAQRSPPADANEPSSPIMALMAGSH